MSFKTYSTPLSTKQTPQTEPIPGKRMVQNNQGGFSFAIDQWKQLDRFLILGSVGGTYYATERKLTIENGKIVKDCLLSDYRRTIDRIVEISDGGKAIKNSPAIFALAIASSTANPAINGYALAKLNKVCRFGTALFEFVAIVQEMRGWGPALRKAIANWYNSKDASSFAYQVTKYQQREGWSHKDLMHLCHYRGQNDHKIIQHWVEKGWDSVGNLPHPNPALQKIWAFEWLKRNATPKNAVKCITDYGLTREMIPTELLNTKEVWGALLEDMPMTAMIRNLGNLTKHGIIAPLSNGSKKVIGELTNLDRLKKGRVHPLSILVALKIYAQGHGDKGSSTWTQDQKVVDALDDAFYLAFDAVESTCKRWMLGIDVSGSMTSPIAGSPLSCCEAATAMALVTTHVEPWTFTGRFNTGFQECPFNRKTRLDEALRYTRSVNCGGTDCSMPILAAMTNNTPVDVFVILTDSETAHGRIHPAQAIKMYRDKMGIPAKVIVAAFTSNGFSIADPEDSGMLDLVGFSTDIPQVMSNFVTD